MAEEKSDFDIDVGGDFSTETKGMVPDEQGNTFKKDHDTEGERGSSYSGGNSSGGGYRGGGKPKGINLFDDEVTGKPIDMKASDDYKGFVFSLATPTSKISDDDKPEVEKILRKLAIKGYSVRVACDAGEGVLPLLDSSFDHSDIEVWKPWEKFCKVSGFTSKVPTDICKTTAAYYIKKFNVLNTAVKHFKSSLMGMLFGENCDKHISMIIVYDPAYKPGTDLDFNKSKSSATLILVPFTFKEKGFSIYNLYIKDDREKLSKVLD